MIDVLVPTCGRPAALAVTLTSLFAQTLERFRVVVSDQTEDHDVASVGEVSAVKRVLEARDCPVEVHKHLPRRGMAEQRAFLLGLARAPYALFLDDDVIVEPDLLARLLKAIRAQRCGFVGSALVGLSYLDDEREQEQAMEMWEGPVQPERVEPGTPQWERHRLHNAANLWHVQRRLGVNREHERLYKVAWVGGCVLYDVEKLRACGGFSFWPQLPPDHAGEDVLAQMRVMEKFGGCGLIPSGAYHQELVTTLESREVDSPRVLT